MIKMLVAAVIGMTAFTMTAGAQETKSKTVRLPDIEIGLGDAGFGVTQGAREMTVGTNYRMWLKATGKKECAFQAAEFLKTVKWRKIEVNKVEIKAQTVTEIEFENEGSAELFFTPEKAGEYTWVCAGFEDKGMTGKFVVK